MPGTVGMEGMVNGWSVPYAAAPSGRVASMVGSRMRSMSGESEELHQLQRLRVLLLDTKALRLLRCHRWHPDGRLRDGRREGHRILRLRGNGHRPHALLFEETAEGVTADVAGVLQDARGNHAVVATTVLVALLLGCGHVTLPSMSLIVRLGPAKRETFSPRCCWDRPSHRWRRAFTPVSGLMLAPSCCR